MAKPKFNKEQLPAIISMLLIFGSYIAEKAFKRLADWSSTSALIQAFAYTAAVLAVFLLLYNSKDYFLGMLTSILAFKILPPEMEMLRQTAFDASAVYFLVRKAALAMFLYLVYYFYQKLRKQSPDDYVHVWGLASIMLIFPYIQSVASDFEQYALLKTHDMMYVYALQAIAFVIIFAIMYGFCFKFPGATARLICDYAAFVLVVRIFRKATSVLIIAHSGAHVSKSYFAWIAICTVLLVCSALIRKKTVLPETVET